MVRNMLKKVYRKWLKPIRLFLIPRNSRREARFLELYYALRGPKPVSTPLFAVDPDCWPDEGDRVRRQRGDYAAWIAKNEPDAEALMKQKEHASNLEHQVLISIVTPVYLPPLNIFVDTVEAVRNQTYPNWEWCIADGSLDNVQIRQYLQELATVEPRIRVKFLEQNRGISANTNEAIKMARGEYIAFMDHDDMLAPFAIYEVAKTIKQHPSAELFYSDEDRVSENGQVRYDPCFRPDFSPEILRSNNYMPHFIVVKRELGEKIGWLRSDFDGSQDHDFILRASEKASRVVHIPKILYHWRAIQGSAALTKEAKPYTHGAGRQAVIEHLERIGRRGSVGDGHDANYHRPEYVIPPQAMVTILIPYPGIGFDKLKQCVNSVVEVTGYRNFEIIVVNYKQPVEESAFHSLPKGDISVDILEPAQEAGYYSQLNLAAQRAKGDYLLFLNYETEIFNGDWLQGLLEHCIWPETGFVGGEVLYHNNRRFHAGYVVGGPSIVIPIYYRFPIDAYGYFGMMKYSHNRTAMGDFCLMCRKSLFFDMGGFDTAYRNALGDVDLCLQAHENGYLNVWTPYSVVRIQDINAHYPHPLNSDQEYFRKKWRKFLQSTDPFYSPNLTLKAGDFNIRLHE